MAAIAADNGASEKGWGRVVSFSLPTGSGYVEKARKAATNTVQFSQKMLRITGQAAWSAGTSLLIFVVPRNSQMDRDAHMVDLEGGPPDTNNKPGSPSVK